MTAAPSGLSLNGTDGRSVLVQRAGQFNDGAVAFVATPQGGTRLTRTDCSHLARLFGDLAVPEPLPTGVGAVARVRCFRHEFDASATYVAVRTADGATPWRVVDAGGRGCWCDAGDLEVVEVLHPGIEVPS